ncbi:hypothetical protein A4H97_17245 [Niastella yeongjuensis]|uniref:Uncharacterized protein n=2 Tax=Niastella yeongjuensis TaxID=354355 RepID=A0A1V9E1J2_9BACT|nr:hypothetical protein A4H97_17245 [Niastella yeongjuensis]
MLFMKTILFIISFSIIASCNYYSQADTNQLPPEKSSIKVIKLVDSLGSITFSIPSRYDTTFIWTHYSDCGKPCDEIKYRLQPKSLKIFQESGFYWRGEPKDSVERFTIVHSGYFPFYNNTDSNSIFQQHFAKKQNTISDPDTYKIKSDTVEKIGDRYFSIIVIDLYDTLKNQYSKKLLASTTIKGNIVDFKYELLTKRNDSLNKNFITNSKYYLRTIRISNGM